MTLSKLRFGKVSVDKFKTHKKLAGITNKTSNISSKYFSIKKFGNYMQIDIIMV